MVTVLVASQALLWLIIVVLALAVFALARQVGILYQRIAPVGALAMNRALVGGSPAPEMQVADLNGRSLDVAPRGVRGGTGKSQLFFFLSPSCPVCKTLLPAIQSISKREAKWLDVVLASDGGAEADHRKFVAKQKLENFRYVMSEPLGVAFAVSRLPYAVLIDEEGIIRGFGIVNTREQLDSLFEARRLGQATIQDYLARGIGQPSDQTPVSLQVLETEKVP